MVFGSALDAKQSQVPIVLWFHRCYGSIGMIMSVVLLHASLCGDIDSDPVEHSLCLLFGIGMVTSTVQSFVVIMSLKVEAAGYSVLLVFLVFCHPIYVMLSPSSRTSNIVTELACGPMYCSIIHVFVAYCNIELGMDLVGSRCMYAVHIGWIGACVCRFCWDPGSRELILGALFAGFLMPMLGHTIERAKAELLLARMHAQCEARRAEEAIASLRAAKAQVEIVSQGHARMLTALCDVRLRLDSELCILEPSGQLCEFLMPGRSDVASQLAGRCFLNFMPSVDDSDRARETLERASTQATSQAAAGAFNVLLKNADDVVCNTEAFYVWLGGDDQPVSYLLGLRLGMADVGLLAEPEAPRVAPKVEQYPAHAQPILWPDDDAREDATNTSRVGVVFDAGSRRFEIIGGDLFGRPRTHSLRPEGLLSRLSMDQAKDFEEWVVQTVEDAPWDQTCTSEPFQGSLTMLLPRVGRRWLRATKVFLETAPPESDKLPTTLWMEGLSMQAFEDHTPPVFAPLESVQESDLEEREADADSAVSEILPWDSVSIRSSQSSYDNGDATALMWPSSAGWVEELPQHVGLEQRLHTDSSRVRMRSPLPPVMHFS
eukprot:CAMPEP_0204167904 /NCGR_PEP_ID=MMETSP0361-20130328/40265_1 /ASSEMBLY_ACC=CAM_ASM_000343 /TAXON_ID=268821 /ORGANISM="Scrippsiella Hangoei, Strain SHTV-5" /LENGTH=601 /DNA_ID=CAMNT_0051125285 /DNA_START=1 /DNA_END=1803 /DNA_ORIENTATION=-